MGKILDIYQLITSRLDTAVASGTLTYMHHHFKGNRKEVNKESLHVT